MLLGEHEHTLDDKNRLTLPAKFRAGVRGRDRRDAGAWTAAFTPTRGRTGRARSRRGSRTLDPLSKESRRLRRYFYSGASEDELDKQGRITIPAALMQHAELERDVVVAGVHDHLEIWDRAAWRRELAEVEGSAEDVAERLAAQRD